MPVAEERLLIPKTHPSALNERNITRHPDAEMRMRDGPFVSDVRCENNVSNRSQEARLGRFSDDAVCEGTDGSGPVGIASSSRTHGQVEPTVFLSRHTEDVVGVTK